MEKIFIWVSFAYSVCCSAAKLCLTFVILLHTHTGLPCPSLSPEVCSDSCPLIWWCYLTISFSATPFFFFILSNLCLIYTWARVEIFIFNNLLKQVLTPSFSNRDLYGKVSGLYRIYMSDSDSTHALSVPILCPAMRLYIHHLT